MDRRRFLQSASATASLITGSAFAQAPRPAGPEQNQRSITETLVTAQTEDKLEHSGLVFNPSPLPAKPVAVIWVHGATANFYYPAYVAIARKMAADGYTFILGNTRMHDIGC